MQAKVYSLIEEGQKGFALGKRWRGGGQEKVDGLYPSLFWVLDFCKNCMTFGNCKEFYRFNVLAMSQ